MCVCVCVCVRVCVCVCVLFFDRKHYQQGVVEGAYTIYWQLITFLAVESSCQQTAHTLISCISSACIRQ